MKFAKLTQEQRASVLSRALNCGESFTMEIVERIESELEYEENLLNRLHRKGSVDFTPEEKELIEKIRYFGKLPNTRRVGPVEQFIRLRCFSEIEELRARGYSWRPIAEYIRREHRKKIHPSTLCRVYNKVIEERDGTD